jgi:PAS domain S-box-containing protein
VCVPPGKKGGPQPPTARRAQSGASREAELRESERLLRQSQAVARLGSYVLDVPTGQWRGSAVLDEIFGIDETHPRDVAGWVAIIHPDMRSEMLRYFQDEVLGTKQRFDREYRIVRPCDGRERWVHGLGDLQLDKSGRVIRMVGTIQDVTDRKLAEDALRESEDRFRLLSEAAFEGIGVSDQGRIVDCNERLATMLGYAPHELIGMSVLDMVAPESHPIVAEHMRTGSGDVYEHLARRKDGSVFLVEVQGRALPHRGRVLRVSAVRDITDRRRAEEALRRSQEQYQALVEGVRDVIFAMSPDGTLNALNPAFEETTGWPREEWLGKPFFGLLHPDDMPAALGLLQRVLRDEPRPTAQLRVRSRGGGYRVGEFHTAVQRRDGAIVGILGIVRDITDRLALEEQFRQAQKMEAVGQLAGGVAHDFNNLLTVIRSYSDLLLDGLPADDERRADIEEIREAARRATLLTRQLLAFSRRQVLQPTLVSLNDVVAGAERLLRRLIGEDVPLVTRLDPALGTVKADPGQVEQVIMNLAVNARDAMPNGGTLTVETANVPLGTVPPPDLAAIMPPAEYALLRVSDTGVGMDAETKVHLFEPFFTTKEVGKGTGLGLATVYGVVKQSGGYISVESEPGRGAAFSIYLPRVRGVAEASGVGPGRQGSPEGDETILLVEDEPAVRTVASEVLRGLGYAVLEASDANAALRLAEAHAAPIALLVTDVVMPGMDGRELADRLRANRPGLKVLLVSGYAYDTALEHGALEGVLNFLQKPFTPDGLARRVRDALDRPAASPPA